MSYYSNWLQKKYIALLEKNYKTGENYVKKQT